MTNGATTIENERGSRLQQARNLKNLAGATVSPTAKAKLALSFGQKVSKHWPLLGAAAFFDLLGLIPFLGVIFNFLFGLVLLFRFGPKGGFKKIGLPVLGGSVCDLFFVGIFPACIGATLLRIYLN